MHSSQGCWVVILFTVLAELSSPASNTKVSEWLTCRAASEWLAVALSKHFVVTFSHQSLHTKWGVRRQWQQHVASQSVSYILSLWFHHGQRRRTSIQQISPLIFLIKKQGGSLLLSAHVMWVVRPRHRGWNGARDALEQNVGLIFWRGLLCLGMYY